MSALNERARPLQPRSLSALAEDMIYRLPGASDLAVRKELQRAARQFCQETAVMGCHILVRAEERRYRYALYPPMAARVSMVRGVTYLGRDVPGNAYRISRKHLDAISFDETWLDSAFRQSDDGEVNVVVHAALVPELGAEDFPEEFLEQWGDAIVAAAMWRLAGTQGVAWSNPGLAQMEFERYRSFVTDATMERLGGIEERDLDSRAALPWLV